MLHYITLLFILLAPTAASSQISQDAVVGSSGGGGGITALTGDCVGSGSGSVAMTCGFKTAGAVANLWQVPITNITGIGAQSATMAASTISCLFGTVPVKQTISNVGAAVSTLAASGNFQIAIYSNVNARPGALISNSGNLSTASVGTITGALAANKQIGPGGSDSGPDVWWCSNVDASAGGIVKMISAVNSASTLGASAMIGSTTAANVLNRLASGVVGVSCVGVNCQGGSSAFGTWPANLGSSTWTDITSPNVAIPVFQPASVP